MIAGMIDVQRLRVFRAVVASGSVQAAADHLGYTPSAVSQQISALQRETGLVLFEKAGRGIAPTATAKVLALGGEDLGGRRGGDAAAGFLEQDEAGFTLQG